MFLLAFIPDSEVIKAAAYDSELEELDLYFTNGRAYRYQEVPLASITDMLGSESIGAYHNQFIKPQFACHLIYPYSAEAQDETYD